MLDLHNVLPGSCLSLSKHHDVSNYLSGTCPTYCKDVMGCAYSPGTYLTTHRNPAGPAYLSGINPNNINYPNENTIYKDHYGSNKVLGKFLTNYNYIKGDKTLSVDCNRLYVNPKDHTKLVRDFPTNYKVYCWYKRLHGDPSTHCYYYKGVKCLCGDTPNIYSGDLPVTVNSPTYTTEDCFNTTTKDSMGNPTYQGLLLYLSVHLCQILLF